MTTSNGSFDSVLELIETMQAQAEAQGGKLTDLALPAELYDALIIELGDKAIFIKGKLNVNGTPVHMGEDD